MVVRLLLPLGRTLGRRHLCDSVGSGGQQLRKHWEKRLVNCKPRELYNLVADVDSYREFVPWCVGSEVKKRSDDGLLVEAELAVGFQMLSAKYTSQVLLVPDTRVRASAVASPQLFHSLVNEWNFTKGPVPGTTWLTFWVEFEFANPVYQQISDLFFEKVSKSMVSAFETRLKTIQGSNG